MEINEKLEVFLELRSVLQTARASRCSMSRKIFISRQWKNMSSPAVMHLKAQDAFS